MKTHLEWMSWFTVSTLDYQLYCWGTLLETQIRIFNYEFNTTSGTHKLRYLFKEPNSTLNKLLLAKVIWKCSAQCKNAKRFSFNNNCCFFTQWNNECARFICTWQIRYVLHTIAIRRLLRLYEFPNRNAWQRNILSMLSICSS